MKLIAKVFKDNDILEDSLVAIVLGGPFMIPNRCNRAIELYKEKKIKYILVSGGVGYLNKDKKNTEGKLMLEYLLKNGVPKEDILVEDKSRNTYENALFTREIIKDKLDLANNFILITSEFHSNRSYLLFKNIFGDNTKIFCSCVKDQVYDKDKFYKSTRGLINILKEYILLRYYIYKNIIKKKTLK